MTILAASNVLLGLILKFIAGGWFVLIFMWFYLAISVAHVVIHRKASQSIPQNRALAIVSNVLLLMAFLFQFDEGDGPCGWTTITNLLYGPGFEPCFRQQISPVLTNPIAFVPVAITWVFLVAKTWTMRAVGLVLIILAFFVPWLAIIVFGPDAIFIGLKFGFVPLALAILWLTVRMITKKPPPRAIEGP
jgi:hypothetical protein